MESEAENAARARQALDQVARVRAQMADRLRTPKWYYPALGALMAVWLGEGSLHSVVAFVLASLVVLFGFGVLIGVYRQATGLQVNSWHYQRALRAVIRYELAVGALAGLAAVAEFVLGWRGAFVGAGAAALAITVWRGPKVEEVFRREIRAGQ